jgi:hypothetical protein
MAITINNFTAVLAGDSVNLIPFVQADFKVVQDTLLVCHVPASGFQYCQASASGDWTEATLMPSTPGTAISSYSTAPGRSAQLFWDVDADLPGFDGDVFLRLKLMDSASGESAYVQSGAFLARTEKPSLSFSLPAYINGVSQTIAPSCSGEATHYQTTESLSFPSAWAALSASGTMSVSFASAAEGTKTLRARVRDAYFNVSQAYVDSTVMHTTPPASLVLGVEGAAGAGLPYTGMVPTSSGFVPDRSAVVSFYASDALDLEVRITGLDSVSASGWFQYTSGGDVLSSSVSGVLPGDDYGFDDDVPVTMEARDAAGNTSSVTSSIRLNTKVLQTAQKNLVPESSSYAHQVFMVTLANAEITVPSSETSSSEYIRKWKDVFYPASHSFPVDANGDFDAVAGSAMAGVSNEYNDAPAVSAGALSYDTEGRPRIIAWTTDGTKNYSNLESSHAGNVRSWVIDNTGYGDIELEFEHFRLDSGSYGPPYNKCSPHTGDVLVVYDATAAGALKAVVSSDGSTAYELDDSSKLVEIMAFTGSGSQVLELTGGYLVGADVNGGFVAEAIKDCAKICLILYTDASSSMSGFRLKSGPKHETVFSNYDMDNVNGELWLHRYPNGAGYNGTVRMVYDYYDADVSYSLDEGRVVFAVPPSGEVTADYSHYIKEEDLSSGDRTRMYLAGDDDFVDYLDPVLRAAPSGAPFDDSLVWTPGSPSGVVDSHHTWDKDRGIVEFENGAGYGLDEFYYTPSGSRVQADYYRHTYTRLSNDGRGQLEFRNSLIVADNTTVYPDFTWGDIKFVNEGEAILENGKFEMVARGYDNDGDGTVDQVVDVNRPWDIQTGTAAETHSRSAVEMRQYYTFNATPVKSEASSAISVWKNKVFGFVLPPRGVCFGRCFWCLDLGGNSYPSTTAGKKAFSGKISGKYYDLSV